MHTYTLKGSISYMHDCTNVGEYTQMANEEGKFSLPLFVDVYVYECVCIWNCMHVLIAKEYA